MLRSRLAVLLIGLLMPLAGTGETGTRLHIQADGVDLLAAAEADAESVGQVSRGDVVVATGVEEGNWVQIEAPVSAAVFVYGELIRDNVVAVNSVKVRAGPGIGYRSVGDVAKGAAVVARGQKGDWIQIAPPASVRLWIKRDHVGKRGLVPAVPPPVMDEPAPEVHEPIEPPMRTAAVADPVTAPPLPPAPAKPVVAAPPSAPGKSTGVPGIAAPVKVGPTVAPREPGTSEQWVAPPERPFQPVAQPLVPVLRPVVDTEDAATASGPARVPRGLALVAGAPQGAPVTMSGELRPAGLAIFRPSAYRLVDPLAPGPARTVCYVTGGAALGKAVGRRVSITGRKYWVQGVRAPVVVADSLR